MTEEEFNALPVAQPIDEETFNQLPVAVDASNFEHVPVAQQALDLVKYAVEQAGVASGNMLDLANKIQPINVSLAALGLQTPASRNYFSEMARQPQIEEKAKKQNPLLSEVAGAVGQSIPYAITAGAGPATATLSGQSALGGLMGLSGNIEGTPTQQVMGTGTGLALGALLGKATGAPSTVQQVEQRAVTQDIAQRGPQLFDAVNDQVDPVHKIINALKVAQPIRAEQENLYTAERAKRFEQARAVGSFKQGQDQFYTELGALKGALPRAQYESIRPTLNDADVTELFNRVRNAPGLSFTDTIEARHGLANLLGAEGASVPTESQLELLSKVFPPEFTKALLDKRTLGEKVRATLLDVANVPRAFMASIDLSAPFRQGAVIGPANPKEWGSAFKSMLKYAVNEDAYQGLLDEISMRPTYPLMSQTKLAITNAKSPLMNQHEEGFMSNLAERIPIIGTHLIRGSDRAYSGFLTKLRADTFDSLYQTLKESYGGNPPYSAVEALSKFINTATGRGSLGALNKSAPLLNAMFFSPRLIASRITLLNPAYYVTQPPGVRKAALKTLFAFTSSGLAVLGLAKAGGLDVGTDPTSSNFGKIKVGNTRYDIWGGLQQYVVLASRLISGISTSSVTGKTTHLGQGYKSETRLSVLMNSLRNKLAPIPAFAAGLLSGRDPIGRPFDVPRQVGLMFTPMAIQDAKDVIKDKGWMGVPMSVPGFLGVGQQTYTKGSK